MKKVFLKISQISQENTCVGAFFSKVARLFRTKIYQNKKRLEHRFFCEICEIAKSTYFEEHLRMTASKLLFREKPHWLSKMRFIDIANTFHKDRSSRPKLFCKNVVFKKFTKFTIKQLCGSLVLKKAAFL